MALRIAIVMPALLPMPPVDGGAVETLVDALLTENERVGELEVTVLCRYNSRAALLTGNYVHARFEMLPVRDGQMWVYDLFARALKKLLRLEIRPQAPYLGRVLKRLKRGKWDAAVVENVAPFVLPVKRAAGAQTYLHMHNRYLRPELDWSREIVKSDVRVITVSDFLRREALTVPGASDDQVRTLPNSIDIGRFNRENNLPLRRELRVRFGIPEQDVVFLFTGRLLPEKGVAELLEAFMSLEASNAWLMIVGSGWFSNNSDTPYLKRLRELSAKSARVVFTGYVAYGDMPGIYAAADVACAPSLWEESAGLTVVEAMASSLPLITTGSGGIGEYITRDCALVTPRGEGLVSRLAKAMKTLLTDTDMRRRMGQRSREASLRYGRENYYRAFCGLLKNFHGEAET